MPLRPMMMPLGGEVGALDVLHQVGQVASGLSSTQMTASMTSRRLWGGMLVAMPTAMPAGAVDQQVGEPGGEAPGLLAALVKVGVPVHGLLVDVPQHLVGDFGQPGLGVTVGGGGSPSTEPKLPWPSTSG